MIALLVAICLQMWTYFQCCWWICIYFVIIIEIEELYDSTQDKLSSYFYHFATLLWSKNMRSTYMFETRYNVSSNLFFMSICVLCYVVGTLVSMIYLAHLEVEPLKMKWKCNTSSYLRVPHSLMVGMHFPAFTNMKQRNTVCFNNCFLCQVRCRVLYSSYYRV